MKRFSTSTRPLAQHNCIRIIAISFAVVYRFLATVFDPRDCTRQSTWAGMAFPPIWPLARQLEWRQRGPSIVSPN